MPKPNNEILTKYRERSRDPLAVQFDHSKDRTHQGQMQPLGQRIEQLMRSGGPLPPQTREAFYGDLTGAPDLEQALERVSAAQAMFLSINPEVREYFDNDPVKLLEYLDQVDDLEAAEVLGYEVHQPTDAPSEASQQDGGPGTELPPDPAAEGSGGPVEPTAGPPTGGHQASPNQRG